MRKTFGMNKHQKAAHKPGERHTSSEEIAELLEMSCSIDADDRLVAAEHLCPCHVRKRIETVWDALYRLMADSDPRVRLAAWHTLEDGGRPDDPKMLAILENILNNESDQKVRRFANGIVGKAIQKTRDQEVGEMWLAGRAKSNQKGKCDFCGAANVPVDFDPETPIPTDYGTRTALICERCSKSTAIAA